MRSAARIADRFKIDPIEVLNSDKWNLIIRSAAYAIVVEDDRKAQEAARNRHNT